MSYQTGHHHRRILASQDHQTPMEPTQKTDLNPITKDRRRLRLRHRHPPPLPIHPTPDPTLTTPPSTIQNISQRFSKLYTNHKKIVSMSFKPHSPDLHPHPQPETYFPPKPITYSPVLDTSCTTLTKSRSQIERNGYNNHSLVNKDHFFSSNAKAKEQDGSKKQSLSKNVPKKPAIEEIDVDKETKLMSKSLESNEEVKKRIQVQPQGFEARRSSVSSMVVVNNGGRRRSFCNSKVELADFLSCNGVKVVAVDMPPFMQIHAVDCARKAHDGMEKLTSKTLALTLKKEFDGVYGPAWHCIVGTSFGSFVTHSVGGFMYFSMDHKLYVLLFKTNVHRAE